MFYFIPPEIVRKIFRWRDIWHFDFQMCLCWVAGEQCRKHGLDHSFPWPFLLKVMGTRLQNTMYVFCSFTRLSSTDALFPNYNPWTGYCLSKDCVPVFGLDTALLYLLKYYLLIEQRVLLNLTHTSLYTFKKSHSTPPSAYWLWIQSSVLTPWWPAEVIKMHYLVWFQLSLIDQNL